MDSHSLLLDPSPEYLLPRGVRGKAQNRGTQNTYTCLSSWLIPSDPPYMVLTQFLPAGSAGKRWAASSPALLALGLAELSAPRTAPTTAVRSLSGPRSTLVLLCCLGCSSGPLTRGDRRVYTLWSLANSFQGLASSLRTFHLLPLPSFSSEFASSSRLSVQAGLWMESRTDSAVRSARSRGETPAVLVFFCLSSVFPLLLVIWRLLSYFSITI